MKKGMKRKEELLKIAYQMFLMKGYEETSVDEIIEKAGIAKGTYYYYFKSKEQMLEEVIGMMLDEEVKRAEAIKEQDLSVPEKIVGIIAAIRPDPVEMTIEDALNKPENIVMHEKINRRLIEMVVPILSEVVEQGVQEGLFNCSHIPERVKMLLLISSEVFDDERFTENDIEVFIDVAESTLHAKHGTMGFIRRLISAPKREDEQEDEQ